MVCLGMRYALTRDFFFELGIWNLEFIKKLNYFFLICCVIWIETGTDGTGTDGTGTDGT
jgi:hypothetical protein